MAVFYVNKSGNDANSGRSPNNAKLTIQGAINSASNYDTIIIQSGVYNEAVVMNGKSLHILCDGLVILDGQNTLQEGINLFNTSGATINQNSQGILFIMNYTLYGIRSPHYTNFIYRCVIYNCPNGVDGVVVITNCILIGTGTGNNRISSGYTNKNNIIANFNTGVAPSGNPIIVNSIFYNNAVHIDRNDNSTFNKNIYYPVGVSNVFKNAGTTYTDLPTWRTATGQDANSDALDPQFLDPNNLLFGVANTSPAKYSSLNPPSGEQPYPFCGIGALSRRIGISNTVNNLIWTGATVTNLTLGADGSWRLTNPNLNGVWESGAIDLQTLSGYTPAPGQTLGIKLADITQSISYPSRVLDSNNTDAKPNRLTFEIATSSDGINFSPYQVFEPYAIMNLAYRYIKLKITFRMDGVGG